MPNAKTAIRSRGIVLRNGRILIGFFGVLIAIFPDTNNKGIDAVANIAALTNIGI